MKIFCKMVETLFFFVHYFFSAFLPAISIHCKLATPNDESSDMIVNITNVSQLPKLKICHIYFSTGNFVNYWKDDILPFILPLGNTLLHIYLTIFRTLKICQCSYVVMYVLGVCVRLILKLE